MKQFGLTKSRSFNIIAALVALPALIGLPDLAFAAAEEHAHHGTIADLKWPWINFALYVVGMFFLLRGIVASGWRARAERIAAEASRGERELATANATLAAMRERQARLPTEKASIARTLTNEAQAEAAKTLSDAEERAREIEKQAANRIVAEQQAAVQAIRRQVATKVLNASELKIKSGISTESDKKIRSNTAHGLVQLKVS